MNLRIDLEIRESIGFIHAAGISLCAGAWFEWNQSGIIVRCDPIGAVLIKNNQVPEYNLIACSIQKGLIHKARHILNVDNSWLHRFWLGYDRGYHVSIIRKEGDKEVETKDEVSSYGISLYKEFIKNKTT